MDDVRFCFDVFDDFEQTEDGDTLIHTFSLVDWPICVTKWLYLWGSRAGVVCVSTSVPFHFHRTAPLFPPRGVIDSLEFDAVYCGHLDIIPVTANVYLIAYTGQAGAGFLKTVSIESNGQIGAVIHWTEFDPVLAWTNSLAHIPGTDKYIVGFQGPGNDGYLRTFSVSDAGVFGPIIGTFFIDGFGYSVRYFRFYQLAGTAWLLAYQGSGNAGWFLTININPDGTFGALIDKERFDRNMGAFPALVHISGNIFAVAYTGPDSDGWLKTWEVSPDGFIAAGLIGMLEFDNQYCHSPQMRHISGNVYAIAYQGQPAGPATGNGWIKTLTIADDGTIGGIIDTFQFTHGFKATLVTAIIPAGDEAYIIAYTAHDDHGQVVKVTIHDDGQIDEPLVDELEFDDTRCIVPEMIPISGPVFAIAYSGVDEHGWIKTVSI